MAAGKLLIVDDQPDWRRTLAGLFVDAGYDVKVAGSTELAVQLLEKEYFNLAILDVRLDESDEGNRDGLHLLRTIKRKWPSMEVIILTGYADVSMAQEALNTDSQGARPAYGFIKKDQTDELMRQVKQAYEKSINFLISQGEQENIEFKSSIRWDHEKNGVNRDIQFTIAKSIAGMLNYRGGTLLIGVADDGSIVGIDKDLIGLRKPDTDGFRLLLTEVIRNYLGLEYSEFVHARFEGIHNKTICVISIDPSSKPSFVSSGSKSEFWIRTGNSTRQLDVREATDYIQNHWGK
jgi:ActR/RegA family two-component response regulator